MFLVLFARASVAVSHAQSKKFVQISNPKLRCATPRESSDGSGLTWNLPCSDENQDFKYIDLHYKMKLKSQYEIFTTPLLWPRSLNNENNHNNYGNSTNK